MWSFLQKVRSRETKTAKTPIRLKVIDPRELPQETDAKSAIPAVLARKKDPTRLKSLDTLWKKATNAIAQGDTEKAIRHLESVLRIDGAHVEARAQLGRLRFVQPSQPLLEAIRAGDNPIDVCEVVIEVRNPCNYRCHYCVAAGHNDVPVRRFDLEAVGRSLSAITAKLVVTSFDCGGGEPTIHPQFPELVRLCAERGPVSFPTNNSQNPERWLPKETARRIFVRAAVHTEAEQHLEKYARNARYLIDAGCDFTSIFVSHPTRIAKVPEYRKFFEEMGVPFTPVSFIGDYEGRHYPHAYSDEEKQTLGLTGDQRTWFHKIEPHVTRIRNFRGIPCLAGFRSVFISHDGTVRRCLYDQRVLEKPLDTPEPCGVKNCGCGIMLEKLNIVESIDFHNYWAPKAGLPLYDVSWIPQRAAEMGYSSVADGMAVEHSKMYDELMRAYGKDDIPEK